MKAKDWFSDFGRGATLGTGILPGVSVGTVGFIVNVYNKLIDSIDGLRHRKTFRQSFLALLPIALGCIAAVVLLLLFWKRRCDAGGGAYAVGWSMFRIGTYCGAVSSAANCTGNDG